MKKIILLMAAMAAVPLEGLAQKDTPTEAPAAPAGVAAPGQGNALVRSSRRVAPTPVTTANNFGSANGFFTTGSRGDSIPPVMIRFSQPDTKTSAELEEDLFVMARVISRTLERADADKVNYKLGIPMLLTGSGRSVRPMYVEGLGPLFMIKVNFALMPPPKADERTTPAGVADSEWNEAHRDVFGAGDLTQEESSSRSGAYNQEQVELLKTELIGALKNAAHIRGLKPDEFVSIAVFGNASPVRVMSTPSSGEENGARYTVNAKALLKLADAGVAGKGTVMTLRVRKRDIDEFAQAKFDSGDFKTNLRSKVTVTTYFGSGASTTSINSWIQESPGRITR
jgi:hypothetical protein